MVSTTTQLDDEAAEAEKRFEPIRGKVRTERYTAQPTSIENGPIESESEHRTYLIIGNGRGGTSMVAGVAHLLGLELNAPKGGGFEDHDFTRVSQGLVPEGPPLPLDLSPEEITARLRATVELRNSQHDVWGWKDPSADLYLPDLDDLLRNPHLIIVWRDPAAIATALMAANGLTTDEAFRVVLSNIQRYWNLIKATEWPTLMVSYERGRLKPKELATEMAAFLGLELTEPKLEKILEFCSPTGGYLENPENRERTPEEWKALRDSIPIPEQDAQIDLLGPEPLDVLQAYIGELEARIESERERYEEQRLTDEQQRNESRSYIDELESRLEQQHDSNESQKTEYRAYIGELEARNESERERYEERRNESRSYIDELELRLKQQHESDESQKTEYRAYIGELEARGESERGYIAILESRGESERAYIADLEERLVAQRDRFRRMAGNAMRTIRRSTP